jgi:hypothetical protein
MCRRKFLRRPTPIPEGVRRLNFFLVISNFTFPVVSGLLLDELVDPLSEAHQAALYIGWISRPLPSRFPVR